MKRIIALILTVLMSVSVVTGTCLSSNAAETDNKYNLRYKIRKNKTVAITGYVKDGENKKITIPEKIDGYKVTVIEANAFKGLKKLETIKIPDTVKVIGSGAFYECKSLKKISAKGVKQVEIDAFFRCKNLATINVPSVVYVGEDAVKGTAWYANKKGGVVYLGKVLYSYKGKCPATVTVKKGTKRITGFAFRSKTTLKNITLPNSIIEIGRASFFGCKNLQQIKLPGKLKAIYGSMFEYCTSLKKVEIPDGVTEIMSYAFNGCESLSKVSLPSKLKFLGVGVFNGCESIKEIKIPKGIKFISYQFGSCTALEKVTLPATFEQVGPNAFNTCTSLKEITLPSNTKSIGGWAFKNCTNLKKIVIPKKVSNINDVAFDGCNKLTIYGKKGSYAIKYAKKKSIPYKYY